MESPNTRESTVDTFKYSNETKGDRESPKDYSSVTPFPISGCE
jgi:hypothetical protein